MNEPTDARLNGDEDDLDADAILAELEAEENRDIATFKTQPGLQTKGPSHTAIRTSSSQQTYLTLKSDDETLQYTTEHDKAIVHFFHPDFARCSVMDEHITTIAQKHADYGTDATEDEVKFARVDVRHAEFVVQKLNVRVLPCVIGFVKGQIKGRIIGFEGVAWGGNDKGLLVTRAVEDQFVDWKILRRALIKQKDDEESTEEEMDLRNNRRGITGRKQKILDEDDDWD